jgi:hypothetical protein
VQPLIVVSRTTQGGAPAFDVDLPLGGPAGIECRSGGANGDFTLVFTFASPLVSVGGAEVSSGTGSVASGIIDPDDAHNYMISLRREALISVLCRLSSGRLVAVELVRHYLRTLEAHQNQLTAAAV